MGTSFWHTGESWPGLPPTPFREPARAWTPAGTNPSANSKSEAAVGPCDIHVRWELLGDQPPSCRQRLLLFLPILPCSAYLSLRSDSTPPPLRCLPCYSVQLPTSHKPQIVHSGYLPLNPIKNCPLLLSPGPLEHGRLAPHPGCPAFSVTVAADPCLWTVIQCASVGQKGNPPPRTDPQGGFSV